MRIEGKTFLATGGASGLGRAAAEAIVAAGGHAVLVDVNAAVGEATVQALGAQARFAQADVTSEADVQAAIGAAVAAFGGLHGVVNAAGIGPAAKVVGRNGPHALDLFEKTIRVNLIGTFNVIRLVAAHLLRIRPTLTPASAASSSTPRRLPPTTARSVSPPTRPRKAGSSALTLPVAREFAPMGIRCVTDRARASSTRRCWRRCRKRRARRSVSRCRSRRVSAVRRNTAPWCATSSRTRCSTAR